MAKAPQLFTREELKRRYGEFWAVRTKELDPVKVPPGLRPLIPYAELWGVSDDVDRDTLVESAPEVARRDLSEIVSAYFREMNKWLGGPEADAPTSTPEYIAFSNLRLADDYLGPPEDS